MTSGYMSAAIAKYLEIAEHIVAFVQAMVIMSDNDGTRVSLSTKALEPQPGDMLKNPGLVYEKADEMAALFRERTQV